jgi:hypothetical protein
LKLILRAVGDFDSFFPGLPPEMVKRPAGSHLCSFKLRRLVIPERPATHAYLASSGMRKNMSAMMQ